MAKTIDEAVEQLKRDPASPVRTKVGNLTIEMRAVTETPAGGSAAEIFANLKPWAGETTEEILAILADHRGPQRHRGGA